MNTKVIRNVTFQGWRGGSVVKSTDCSSREPEFNSQHPHDSLQLSVIPVPRAPTPHTDIHANTNVYRIQIYLYRIQISKLFKKQKTKKDKLQLRPPH